MFAKGNRDSIKAANDAGFVINLSANNLTEADKLQSLGIGPVAALVPEVYPDKGRTPGGLPVVVCHAQTGKRATCAECGLCAVRDRAVVVAFRSHGAAKSKAEVIAQG